VFIPENYCCHYCAFPAGKPSPVQAVFTPQFLPFFGQRNAVAKQVLPKGNFFDQKIRKEIFGTGSKVKTVFQKLPKVLVIIK